MSLFGNGPADYSFCKTTSIDSAFIALWMASSEVDQRALANLAAATTFESPLLSAMLYKILGLSIMLSKKLLRARRLRRLDPTRETKSLQLYHHVIWLSREGLAILERHVLPMVHVSIELQILAYKLKASFYHIFVLFHNQPAIHSPGILSLSGNPASRSESPSKDSMSRFSFQGRAEELTVPLRHSSSRNSPRAQATKAPPGLAPVRSSHTAAFLLPALDYTPTATAYFNQAVLLADQLLPGSHPLRLSIKLEYAAYLYDCLHDSHACRRLAKQAISDVYNAQEGMDDESFTDAAEIVRVLGKMVKRGRKTSTLEGGSTTTPSMTPGGENSRSDGSRSQAETPPPRKASQPKTKVAASRLPIPVKMNQTALSHAVPDPTIMNPI